MTAYALSHTYQEVADRHGNRIATEGCDRCYCGSKYWEQDRCVDCHTHILQIPLDPEA